MNKELKAIFNTCLELNEYIEVFYDFAGHCDCLYISTSLKDDSFDLRLYWYKFNGIEELIQLKENLNNLLQSFEGA